MRQVDFFQLPRPIQDRFVGAAQGGVPNPILVSRSRPLTALIWYAVGGAILALTLFIARLGFGKLDSSLALQSPALIAVYACTIGASLFCLLRGVAITQAERLLPYRPWIYLFPVGIVDARAPSFRVFDATEVEAVEAAGGRLRVRVSGGEQFLFEVGDPKNIEIAKSAIEESQRALRHAEESLNRRDRAVLDPLSDTGFSNPFSPKTPLIKRESIPLFASVPLAVIGGLALGAGIWWVRNRGSEERLYANARRQDDLAGYKAYLERGGQRADVKNILLPRAELKRAKDSGDAKAVERFAAANPNSEIKHEITTAYRDVLLGQLAKAEAQGSMTALSEFQANSPRHDLVMPELERAKDQVYARALAAFKAKANPDAVPFFTRLLAYARKHGPKVELRFQRRIAQSNETMELAIQKNPYYMGTSSLPSQYLGASHAAKREAKAAATLIERLGQLFPPDVLSFQSGPPLEGETLPAEVKLPTLMIQHVVQLNGVYQSRVPRGVFLGMGMVFSSALRIPGEAKTMDVKLSLWSPPDLSAFESGEATVEQVYEKTLSEAFDRFVKRYLASVLAKS